MYNYLFISLKFLSTDNKIITFFYSEVIIKITPQSKIAFLFP